MMESKLFFKDKRGQRRLITSFEIDDEERRNKEAMRQIRKFCDARQFTIPYCVICFGEQETRYDVGSYTEFFYLIPPLKQECVNKNNTF